jgi:hypothetical protein
MKRTNKLASTAVALAVAWVGVARAQIYYDVADDYISGVSNIVFSYCYEQPDYNSCMAQELESLSQQAYASAAQQTSVNGVDTWNYIGDVLHEMAMSGYSS